MMSNVSCPNCSQPVDPQARTCGYCGVDLALAAVWAEQAVQGAPPVGVPIAPEVLVPRIGDYLIEKGVLGIDELQQALDHQKKQSAHGHTLLLGQALLELKLVSQETLDEAITVQILQLQNALRDSNRQLEQRVQERTRDLQQALARLAELNQLKANFIANISHELRTPLTHIKGYLDLLIDEGLGPLTSHQQDALVVVQRAEERLENLIEDLIQFSLASKGELSLNQSNISALLLVQVACETVRNKARAAQVTLENCAPPHLPVIHGDEDKLGWVLVQLLDNAIKFTKPGGRVRLQADVSNGLVTLAVMDTGIGIAQDQISEIFEPFHQLDGSATRRYGGTGMGLSMARRIIEAHGTKLRADSVVGRGSRFSFSLPAVGTAPAKPTS